MITNTMQYVKWYRACQINVDFMHQPMELLRPMVASWPFNAWRIDVIVPISPPLARGHRFILVITDYFSKWAKVVPLAKVKMNNVTNFIKHHVIHQFGVPRIIIHDNCPQFASQLFN